MDTLTAQETDDLRKAVRLLEEPGLGIKIANYVGKPLALGVDRLPRNWQRKIGEYTKKSLLRVTDAAIFTMDARKIQKASWDSSHKIAATLAGAAGGVLGLAGLAVELPLSTTVMLRSIADIARSEGEDLSRPESRLACIEVFALGGRSKDDDAAESAYFMVRTGLSQALAAAADYVAAAKAGELAGKAAAAPLVGQFIEKVASRFSGQVADKVLAQAIPVLGALMGGGVNYIFIDHFQDMARGHFIVRRLEQRYGKAFVQAQYQEIFAEILARQRGR
ncbi:EcsC family protein [Paralcaligenes sp. KSB-10]|uniref:EcsC family protein n=1 Tax=Paralcaligenes sp. KSB-10 TaxID=2901142 RepID=UPI001E303686|nr:EcsC family protein [Paralcaligenes sp. KSB-10]UHL65458.1 EcsC family protein [Paralcaligenes sp. KSB-10]